MIEDAKRALLKLRREEPTCKTALVKQILPDIEEAIAAGFTLKAIWERCRGAGLGTSYKDFCTYVNRARRDTRRSAATSGRKPASNMGLNVNPVESADFDPLAKLRRVEANRTVFHWNGAPDLDVLVHGKKKDQTR